jgi:hypothetical protein
MVERANERKAGGRGTAFEFGGKRWTLEEAANSAARSKKVIQDGRLVALWPTRLC